jgi:hypothetical protein
MVENTDMKRLADFKEDRIDWALGIIAGKALYLWLHQRMAFHGPAWLQMALGLQTGKSSEVAQVVVLT